MKRKQQQQISKKRGWKKKCWCKNKRWYVIIIITIREAFPYECSTVKMGMHGMSVCVICVCVCQRLWTIYKYARICVSIRFLVPNFKSVTNSQQAYKRTRLKVEKCTKAEVKLFIICVILPLDKWEVDAAAAASSNNNNNNNKKMMKSTFHRCTHDTLTHTVCALVVIYSLRFCDWDDNDAKEAAENNTIDNCVLYMSNHISMTTSMRTHHTRSKSTSPPPTVWPTASPSRQQRKDDIYHLYDRTTTNKCGRNLVLFSPNQPKRKELWGQPNKPT